MTTAKKTKLKKGKYSHSFSKKGRTARIYYGPKGHETEMYWTVAVTDAKKEVIIDGTTAAALRAHPGVTIGCALSYTGMDNAEKFGHPCLLVSVTKSTMLVVDKLKPDGSPKHAVRYGHNYGKLVDLNDTGELKALVKVKPEIMERQFICTAPRKRPTGPHGNHKSKSVSGVHRATIKPLGALQRAVTAGRISEAAAVQISLAMGKRRKAA